MTVEQQEVGGTLPYAKSSSFGWELVGHGEPYVDCGSVKYRGCLNAAAHQNSLDAFHSFGVLNGIEVLGKPVGYLESFYRCCNRKECPRCYESWAGLESFRAAYRFARYLFSKNAVDRCFGKPDEKKRVLGIEALFKFGAKSVNHRVFSRRRLIHVAVSVSPSDYGMNYVHLRRKLYKVARFVGLTGGLTIFHPFRSRDDQKNVYRSDWYFSPHFHIVGFGWIVKTVEAYEKFGWIAENLGVRETVLGTIQYQLSHAGTNPLYHTITWFGDLSYNKFKCEPMPELPKRLCPLCGSELKPLVFVGGTDRPPPQVEGVFRVPVEDWIEKPRRGW